MGVFDWEDDWEDWMSAGYSFGSVHTLTEGRSRRVKKTNPIGFVHFAPQPTPKRRRRPSRPVKKRRSR